MQPHHGAASWRHVFMRQTPSAHPLFVRMTRFKKAAFKFTSKSKNKSAANETKAVTKILRRLKRLQTMYDNASSPPVVEPEAPVVAHEAPEVPVVAHEAPEAPVVAHEAPEAPVKKIAIEASSSYASTAASDAAIMVEFAEAAAAEAAEPASIDLPLPFTKYGGIISKNNFLFVSNLRDSGICNMLCEEEICGKLMRKFAGMTKAEAEHIYDIFIGESGAIDEMNEFWGL